MELSLPQTRARGGPWARAGIGAEQGAAGAGGGAREEPGGRREAEGGGSGTLCSYLTAARRAARDAEERSAQRGQLVQSAPGVERGGPPQPLRPAPGSRLPAAAPCRRAPRRHHAAAPALLAAAARGAAPAGARAEVLGAHGKSRSGPCARRREQVTLGKAAAPPWRGPGRWDPGAGCASRAGRPLAAVGSWGPPAAGGQELGYAARLAGGQGPAPTHGLGTPAPPCGPSEAAPPGTGRPLAADPPAWSAPLRRLSARALAGRAKGLPAVGPAPGSQVSPEFPGDPPQAELGKADDITNKDHLSLV